LSTQSVTINRAVTVAVGVYAPGHLGELTQYLPFEVVDDVLEQTRTVQRRLRELPSRIGVYFVLGLALFPRLGYVPARHAFQRVAAIEGDRAQPAEARAGRGCRWQDLRSRRVPNSVST
jgi:hypothetical protein